MGCRPGAPRLEGPHNLNVFIFVLDQGVGGGAGYTRNEGSPNCISPGA